MVLLLKDYPEKGPFCIFRDCKECKMLAAGNYDKNQNYRINAGKVYFVKFIVHVQFCLPVNRFSILFFLATIWDCWSECGFMSHPHFQSIVPGISGQLVPWCSVTIFKVIIVLNILPRIYHLLLLEYFTYSEVLCVNYVVIWIF